MGITGVSIAVVSLVGVLLLLALPLAIVLHYVTKWKATKGLTDEEQRLLEDLLRDSQAMQSRVDALETILDDEVPEWRRKR